MSVSLPDKNDSTNHMIEALIAVETAMAGESGDGRARGQRLQEARMHLRSALNLVGGVPETASINGPNHG